MREADFKKVLAIRPCARSEHFALHHLGHSRLTSAADLSTSEPGCSVGVVDEACRFGLVVPKRLARRAVTRNLVKRQGRQAFCQARPVLEGGDWLLRLRRAFDPACFVSARSQALQQLLHSELRSLFAAANAGRVM
jgi:ribonuclease P protein component